jgi:hypothetical protein
MYAGLLIASPRQFPLGTVASGTFECRLPSLDALGDERGVLIRFERGDNEAADLVWRHSAAGLQLGWLDAETMEWSQPLPNGFEPVVKIAVSEPYSAPGLAETVADVNKYETVSISFGSAPLLTASTDIFSLGPVRASGILPMSWSGFGPGSQVGHGGTTGSPAAAVGMPGRIRIRFRLPEAGLPGGHPFLSAGRTGAADSIYLRQVGRGRYLLGIDHWGVGSTETAPLAISGGVPHTLFIEMGSLLSGERVPRTSVRLLLDGKVVMDAHIPLYPAKPGEVVVGGNPLGMSTSGSKFGGEIISVRTRQPAPTVKP